MKCFGSSWSSVPLNTVSLELDEFSRRFDAGNIAPTTEIGDSLTEKIPRRIYKWSAIGARCEWGQGVVRDVQRWKKLGYACVTIWDQALWERPARLAPLLPIAQRWGCICSVLECTIVLPVCVRSLSRGWRLQRPFTGLGLLPSLNLSLLSCFTRSQVWPIRSSKRLSVPTSYLPLMTWLPLQIRVGQDFPDIQKGRWGGSVAEVRDLYL